MLFQITQLKIDHNPFAKGFRDTGNGRREKRYDWRKIKLAGWILWLHIWMAWTLRLLFHIQGNWTCLWLNICISIHRYLAVKRIVSCLWGYKYFWCVLWIGSDVSWVLRRWFSNALYFHATGNNWLCSPCAPTRSSRKKRTARQTTPLESRRPLNVSARPRPLPCLPWAPHTWKVRPADHTWTVCKLCFARREWIVYTVSRVIRNSNCGGL